MTFKMGAVVRHAQTERYFDILKSTALIGGSSVVLLAFSMIRSKAAALLLGPEGVGLISIYTSIMEIAQAVAGLGVQSSGVRQIAEADAGGDKRKVGQTVFVLNRLSLVLGVLGACMLAGLALPLAHLTFGDYTHSAAIALLSLGVLFRLVSAGQTTLLQGLREIGSLAKVNILGGFLATMVTVPLLFWLRGAGVAPALVASSLGLLLVSWWYSHRLGKGLPTDPRAAVREDLSAMIRLGFVFMISGLLTFAGGYVIRLIVLHQGDIAAAGLYQAAWTLGSLYAGFILQAMGTDFYPRLTAVAKDHGACNLMVNEQVRVSILLAGPGVLATQTFAPFVMQLFYSSQFEAASPLLRWISLGMLLRVVAWPLGYVVLAQGKQAIFFWTEIAATIVHLGLAFVLVRSVGVVGAAEAFCGLYVWHSILIFVIVRRMTGFRWSAANLRTGLIYLVLAAAIFLATLSLPLWEATALGSLAVLFSVIHAFGSLIGLVPVERLPAALRKWAGKPGLQDATAEVEAASRG